MAPPSGPCEKLPYELFAAAGSGPAVVGVWDGARNKQPICLPTYQRDVSVECRGGGGGGRGWSAGRENGTPGGWSNNLIYSGMKTSLAFLSEIFLYTNISCGQHR